MPILEAHDVYQEYPTRSGPLAVLQGVTLALDKGQAVAVLGPSGSGKSTLLHLFGTLTQPSKGTITVLGKNPSSLPEAELARFRNNTVGFIFQDFELLAELTPLQNVLVPATFAAFAIAAPIRARAVALLDTFGVPARGATGVLSRGERQRVALARALLFDPPIILADEPTASLDAASGAIVIAALTQNARGEGRTVIAASHDMALVTRMDACLRLEHGRVVTHETERAP